MCGRVSGPGLGRYPPQVALALRIPQPIGNQPVGLSFHPIRGGIDPGDHRFSLRFVGVVYVLKDF